MFDLELVKKREDLEATIVQVADCNIGKEFVLIAGPCAVESEKQIMEIAKYAKDYGANLLRGGIFKPRTSPYSFQGVGIEGVEYLKTAKAETGLSIVCEILDVRDLDQMYQFCDVFQIGARNMQNFSLLKELGKTDKPIILKRGIAATVSEWLSSAEYILLEGNTKVILCERGIRTYESYTRNTLDLSSLAVLKELTHLPVIVDPSHATGRRELIYPMSLSSVMAGCDGLMIEMHTNPDLALSDSAQTIHVEAFKKLAADVKATWYFKKNCIDFSD
jgi:phospho-2-dehydro-3-deoxyheptonate aldolase